MRHLDDEVHGPTLADSGSWQTFEADISGVLGNADVVLRFSFDSIDGLFNTFEGFHVDDVEVKIDGQSLAAARLQKLHREQTQQAHTKDDEPFAQGRLSQPHPLKRDGAEHGESSLLVTDPLWDLRAQIARHADDFGVGAVA